MILLSTKNHHVVENHAIEIHVRRGMTVLETFSTTLVAYTNHIANFFQNIDSFLLVAKHVHFDLENSK